MILPEAFPNADIYSNKQMIIQKVTTLSGPSPITFSPTSAFARLKHITISSSRISQVRPLCPRLCGRRASQWLVVAPDCSRMATTRHQVKHSTN